MVLASRRIKQFELDSAKLEEGLQAAMAGISVDDYEAALANSVRDVKPGTIVQAIVDSVDDKTGSVVMDIGGKAEGSIHIAEFGDTLPVKGSTYEVFYDGLDENDTAILSKRRADRLRASIVSAKELGRPLADKAEKAVHRFP